MKKNKDISNSANVNRFIERMQKTPAGIQMRFRTKNNFPAIQIRLTYKNRIQETLTTLANEKLINAVITAMGGDLKPIQKIAKQKPQSITETKENFELQAFEQFIGSNYKMDIEDDFVTKEGDHYLRAIFHITYYNTIFFCLKRDEYVESLIDKAIAA